jgi:hypothetical protein
MTIYVDSAFIPYRGMKMSHMMTDGDIEELHSFAKKLGLRREWFQRNDHYDVSQSKRIAAINLGAKAVSTKELVQICVTDKRIRNESQTSSQE